MPQWNSLITVLSEITRENCEALICCPHFRPSLIMGSFGQGEACGTIELYGKRIHTLILQTKKKE